MSTIPYPADKAVKARGAPLDPDAVKKVEIDVSAWLDGDTLTSQSWIGSSGVVVGDGVASVDKGSGSNTPPAPVEAAGVLTGYIWSDGTIDLGTDAELRVHLRAAFREDDRTFAFEVAHR